MVDTEEQPTIINRVREAMFGGSMQKTTTEIAFDVGDARYISISRAQFHYITATQLFAMLVCGLQAEVIGDAAPTIAQKFDAELSISWMASSGFLTQVCSLLILGKLYDYLEPRWIMLACSTAFLCGSIISAQATHFKVLIAGQALAGLGRSGIAVGSVMILAIICPKPQRAMYISVVCGAYGVMLKIAPIVAGLLLQNHSSERWRWIFWIAVPFQAVTIVLVLGFPTLRRRKASWDQCREFDVLGAMLQAGALATFVLPFVIGTTKGLLSWGSPMLIALYIIAPVLTTAFVYRESRKEGHRRFIPLAAIMKDRSILALAVISICAAFIVAASTFFIPQYLQIVRGSTPIMAALQLLPSIMVGSITSLAIGKLLAFEIAGDSTARYICIAGSTCQIIGGAIFWAFPYNMSMTTFYILTMVTSLGTGSLFAIGITLVLEVIPDDSFGQASAFMNAATGIGSVLGVALQGILVQTEMGKFVESIGGTTVLKALKDSSEADSTDSTDSTLLSLLGLDGSDAESSSANILTQFRISYHNTQKQAFMLYALLGIFSLLAGLTMRKKLLSQAEGPSEHEKQAGVDTLQLEFDAERGPMTTMLSSTPSLLPPTPPEKSPARVVTADLTKTGVERATSRARSIQTRVKFTSLEPVSPVKCDSAPIDDAKPESADERRGTGLERLPSYKFI